MPAYSLCRRLKRTLRRQPLKVRCRFSTAPSLSADEIQLEHALTDLEPQPITGTHRFEPVETPLGALQLEVTYRHRCDIAISDPDQLLSSNIIDMEENFFTHDLAEERRLRSLLQQSTRHGSESSLHSSPMTRVSRTGDVQDW
jgi:hypothetical protein